MIQGTKCQLGPSGSCVTKQNEKEGHICTGIVQYCTCCKLSKKEIIDMYSKRSEQTRVVIIGGGFAGLAAAKTFAEAPVEVLLLDRNNYHTFLPLLYQVAAAEVDPSQIGFPIRTILRPLDNVDFMMAEVIE